MLDNRCRSRHIAFVSSSCVVVVCCCQCWRVLVFIIQASFFFLSSVISVYILLSSNWFPSAIYLFISVRPTFFFLNLLHFSLCLFFSLRGVHFRSIFKANDITLLLSDNDTCKTSRLSLWTKYRLGWYIIVPLFVIVGWRVLECCCYIWPRRYYTYTSSALQTFYFYLVSNKKRNRRREKKIN